MHCLVRQHSISGRNAALHNNFSVLDISERGCMNICITSMRNVCAGFAAVVLEDDEIEVKFYGIDSDRQIYKSEFDYEEDR